MAISRSRFTDLLMPGLRKVFKDGYRGTVSFNDDMSDMVWDKEAKKKDLSYLPDDMSYEEISDSKERDTLAEIIAVYCYQNSKDGVQITMDYDTKRWTAVLQDH